MSLSLKDKVAVVTGSTRGIGFAIAREFAENNGSTTIVCSRNKGQAVRAAEQIRGKVFAAEIDVTDDFSVGKFIDQILSKYGRIDILVNNAGYPFNSNIWYKKFHEVTDQELQDIIRVDLEGSVRLSRAVISSSMLQQGTTKNNGGGSGNGNGGVIINISSTPPKGAPYTIAKAANIALQSVLH
jgi:NAD(P)-dependent dehydrogenase (short-subunit alcohol dehydrogenase family)